MGNTVIHVRFAPNGSVVDIGERPEMLSPQQWFNWLSLNIPATYRALAGGRGVFKVWAPGAADGDEARETFELKPGVCCTIGPEEPHEIRAAPDSDLSMTYLGVVAPERTK